MLASRKHGKPRDLGGTPSSGNELRGQERSHNPHEQLPISTIEANPRAKVTCSLWEERKKKSERRDCGIEEAITLTLVFWNFRTGTIVWIMPLGSNSGERGCAGESDEKMAGGPPIKDIERLLGGYSILRNRQGGRRGLEASIERGKKSSVSDGTAPALHAVLKDLKLRQRRTLAKSKKKNDAQNWREGNAELADSGRQTSSLKIAANEKKPRARITRCWRVRRRSRIWYEISRCLRS